MSHRDGRRRQREERHLCAACRARKAKYQYHGHVRADRQHVLCFQCFRSARERMRARQLAQGAAVAPVPLGASARLGVSAPSASLSAAQIKHRRRMFEYLQAQQRRAGTI